MARHRAPTRRRRGPRLRAVLAGGLVLGVGATATLAAWTDDEYAHAILATSRFDVESSVDGGTYADHPSAPGATMTFNGTGMSPNTHRYGSVLVRTKPGSIAGTLALAAATVTNGSGDTAPLLGAALLYRAVVTTGVCDATAFTGSPTWLVGQAGHVALTTAGTATPAVAAASSTTPGAPTGICFDVFLPAGADNALQGKSATAVWRITATSIG